MDKKKNIGMTIYKIYISFGILAIGMIAASVIFAVIMRYLFNISFTFLEEFISVLFAFTTFWGLGACILENENIIIDYCVGRLNIKNRRRVDIFAYVLTLYVNVTMLIYSVKWIATAGKVTSNGMRIKMAYIYSVMPVGFVIAIICTTIKIVLLVKNKEKEISFKPEDADEESLISSIG